jgi:hypothetical protein
MESELNSNSMNNDALRNSGVLRLDGIGLKWPGGKCCKTFVKCFERQAPFPGLLE